MKKMCKDVKIAVFLMILQLALALIASVLDYAIVDHNGELLAMAMIVIGICTIFPYKIAKGSHFTRYFYAVVVFLSIAYSITTGDEWSGLSSDSYFEKISIFLDLMDIYIVYKLFMPDSNKWFAEAYAET